MKDEFLNRLESFQKSLGVLGKPENKAIWENNEPEIFTLRVTSATTETAKCQQLVADQEKDTAGAAVEKAREQRELGTVLFPMADALAMYYRDNQMDTEAAEATILPSDFVRLRDQQQLAKARLIISMALPLTTGPAAAGAAQYGIKPAKVANLKKETDDVEAIINAPANAIGQRARFTAAARPQWRITEDLFTDMDKLIVQFKGTPAGDAMVADYLKAREINDRGHGPGEEAPAPPPVA